MNEGLAIHLFWVVESLLHVRDILQIYRAAFPLFHLVMTAIIKCMWEPNSEVILIHLSTLCAEIFKTVGDHNLLRVTPTKNYQHLTALRNILNEDNKNPHFSFHVRSCRNQLWRAMIDFLMVAGLRKM